MQNVTCNEEVQHCAVSTLVKNPFLLQLGKRYLSQITRRSLHYTKVLASNTRTNDFPVTR